VLLGQYEEALETFQTGIDRFKRHALFHYSKGVAYRHLQRNDDAMGEYRQAVQESPVLYKAKYNLGVLLLERYRFREAARHFHAALDVRPRYLKAHVNLAILYDKVGERDRALHHYQKYFETGGHDPLVIARASKLGLDVSRWAPQA